MDSPHFDKLLKASGMESTVKAKTVVTSFTIEPAINPLMEWVDTKMDLHNDPHGYCSMEMSLKDGAPEWARKEFLDLLAQFDDGAPTPAV